MVGPIDIAAMRAERKAVAAAITCWPISASETYNAYQRSLYPGSKPAAHAPPSVASKRVSDSTGSQKASDGAAAQSRASELSTRDK